MGERNSAEGGIPISVSLGAALQQANVKGATGGDKRRLLWITVLAVASAVIIGFLAKGMVLLIDLITNIAFHGTFSLVYVAPGQNTLGWWPFPWWAA